jgi:hypothetical protein
VRENQNGTQRKHAMTEEQIKAEITGTKNDRTVFSITTTQKISSQKVEEVVAIS